MSLNPITSMTAVGNRLKPGFIILDKNNRVMEPVRGTKKAPVKPADGLKFTNNDGNIIVPDAKEYEAVTKRGYRKLVGTLLPNY